MLKEGLSSLLCPACGGELSFASAEAKPDALSCGCGRDWPVLDGIVDFVFPASLADSDQEFQRKYDDSAEQYEVGLDWLFASFYEDQDEVRETMVDLLDLDEDSRVLDMGCGTGMDSVHILRRLGAGGQLFLLDLSRNMLELARLKLPESDARVSFFQGNGAHLPFADGLFDSVFHFGGINEFGSPERAIRELTRVTKRGGKVVLGDEGVPPWLRHEPFGQILVNANPLYEHSPPLAALPPSARNVALRWILGNAFYVIDFRVGEGPPPVDLDLPIPGKGDSLRSRWEERKR